MRPFEPIGDLPRWRLIYNRLKTLKVDEVISYDELAKVLDVDPKKERHIVQGALPRASKQLLEVHKHALEVVRGEGYRVVQPAEHLNLAQKRGKRAQRQLVKGNSAIANVDFNALGAEERKAFEVVGRVLTWQIGAMRQLDLRQKNLESALTDVQATVTQSQADQQSLNERLAWLEQREQERQRSAS